ncbi:MAG: hypothetical protein V9E94_18305 [Microthrixaceae bacterium]
MLKLVLPKGSLEKATMELFAAAPTSRCSAAPAVSYSATIDDPRIEALRILRPQEIPTYVADGLFDLGITGRDWVEETGSSDVVSAWVSCATPRPPASPMQASCVAVPEDSPYRSAEDLPAGCAGLDRVHGASPAATSTSRGDRRRHPAVLRRHRGQGARHRRLHHRDHRDRSGAACCGAAGSSTTVLISYTELVANPAAYADPEKAPRDGAGPDAARSACWRPAARCW